MKFELRTHTAEAEVDKLRSIESLRQEMDLDSRQARRERELELAQHQEWREELRAERAELRRQLEVYKVSTVPTGHETSILSTGV